MKTETLVTLAETYAAHRGLALSTVTAPVA